MFVPNLKILSQVVSEKSLTEKKFNRQTDKQTSVRKRQKLYTPYILRIFAREKEKWTNKGTDKQYVADSLIHSTTVHDQALYQISRS